LRQFLVVPAENSIRGCIGYEESFARLTTVGLVRKLVSVVTMLRGGHGDGSQELAAENIATDCSGGDSLVAMM
jgi:hypothetical protein